MYFGSGATVKSGSATTCTCSHWTDPCGHGVAVLAQLAWLVEADPFVLLQLRGLPREELLARLHARDQVSQVEGPDSEDDLDLDAALEAALYAARLLRDATDDAGVDLSGDLSGDLSVDLSGEEGAPGLPGPSS